MKRARHEKVATNSYSSVRLVRSHDRHYRNNAWVICDTCSREKKICVVCGKSAG